MTPHRQLHCIGCKRKTPHEFIKTAWHKCTKCDAKRDDAANNWWTVLADGTNILNSSKATDDIDTHGHITGR